MVEKRRQADSSFGGWGDSLAAAVFAFAFAFAFALTFSGTVIGTANKEKADADDQSAKC